MSRLPVDIDGRRLLLASPEVPVTAAAEPHVAVLPALILWMFAARHLNLQETTMKTPKRSLRTWLKDMWVAWLIGIMP
jgi:hypothetical protein